jgi:uncharacterized protein YukJ
VPLTTYGVLKAAPLGFAREPGGDHFQIHAQALGIEWRIPVKVAVAREADAAMPLFYSDTALPGDLAAALDALKPGFHQLGARPDSLALDYVRGGLVRVSKFRRVVPDRPGAHNDLKDYLQALVARGINEGGLLYAFGEPWGPEIDRPDQFFGFMPGRGVHDVHMNQGSRGKWRRDNGVGQDGALFLSFPDGDWRLLFFAFQTQSFKTTAQGHPAR